MTFCDVIFIYIRDVKGGRGLLTSASTGYAIITVRDTNFNTLICPFSALSYSDLRLLCPMSARPPIPHLIIRRDISLTYCPYVYFTLYAFREVA